MSEGPPSDGCIPRVSQDEELDSLLLQFDDDGSGEIGFREFASIFGMQVEDIDYAAAEKGEAVQKLREAHSAFKAFDSDNSNSIDSTELGSVMRAMGKQFTKKDIDSMMLTVDEDGSGEIDFKEFCELLSLEWIDEFAAEIKFGGDFVEGADNRAAMHANHGPFSHLAHILQPARSSASLPVI